MDRDELRARMRRGDASAWPHWDAQPLDPDALDRAWRHALEHRGLPGHPNTFQVYLHFALCEASCNFCMYFHRVPGPDRSYERLADHLVRRLVRTRAQFGTRTRATNAYFGGGTPSALPIRDLERVVTAFGRAFEVSHEFSCEGHPASLDLAKVNLLADHGVNRISMGLQSLDPQVLGRITRRNPATDRVRGLIEAARDRHVAVNVDLVLGLPGQSLDSFRRDVATVVELGPDVVTMYRYHPVPRLPAVPDPHLDYRRAFDPALWHTCVRGGYLPAVPPAGAFAAKLVRPTRAMRRRGLAFAKRAVQVVTGSQAELPQYAEYSHTDSQLLGIGPGAYSHLFGHAWYREVGALENLPRDPVFWGTRLRPHDEVEQRLRADVFAGRRTNLARLSRVAGVAAKRVQAKLNVDGPVLPAPRRVSADFLRSAERELIVIVGSRDPDRRHRMDAFRNALGIPRAGHRYLDALVLPGDSTSLAVRVGHAREAASLRLHVRNPDTEPHTFYAASRRFALAWEPRPNAPLRSEEQQFLDRLVEQMRRLDP